MHKMTLFDDMIVPLLFTEWGRCTGLGIIVVVGLLLFFTLIQAPWRIWQDIKLVHGQASLSITDSPPPDYFTALIKQIPERHLFGSRAMIDNTQAMTITSLQLRLVGISEAIPEGISRVIIAEAAQPAKVYQLGDSLASGVRISAIMRDSVILENMGHLEKLPLQRPPLMFQGLPKSLLDGE